VLGIEDGPKIATANGMRPNTQLANRRQFCGSALGAAFGFVGGQALRAGEEMRIINLMARSQWLDAAGRQLYLSAFSSQAPGPVIEASPGDRLRINFTNLLSESTNLHFHGLHVPPTGVADNSFLEVRPGESMTYEFDIPAEHPGGTFWYHPHHHGLAARQLSQGLAGPLIIRGVLDEIPEIAQAPQQILLLQDFEVNAIGLPLAPGMMERMQGREGNLITVNGRRNPDLVIQKQGWLRLRIINGSPSRFYRLQISEHSLHQIASDGGALPAVQETDEILLAPGERAEVMVRGNRQPGAYRLLNLPYDRGQMGMMGMGSSRVASPTQLASLVYAGVADSSWDLTQSLTSVEALPQPTGFRSFRLGQNMMSFTINGRTFDPRRADTVVKLNSVEEWEFDNPTDMDHPMHIHTNPFQVIDAKGSPIRAWKDVVVVPARSRVRVRTAFRDFTGRAMYHCHILDHEDLGMMGVLEIRAN